jgi:glyceraldehyde-3-phosphate dehydrogenase (NAD(P))
MKVRVAVNGYGVIGKRIADAVAAQDDMELVGVADVVSDWRIKVAVEKSYQIFGSTQEAADQMRAAGIPVAGTLDDVLKQVDVVADATPKKIAAANLVFGAKFRKQGCAEGSSAVLHRLVQPLGITLAAGCEP